MNESSLFFAMKGERHDGHVFLQDLYKLGMRQFVVESEVSVGQMPLANILKVESSVLALQQLAAHHRSLFKLPVVGITGSNGKTIVKEWLHVVLSPDLQVIKNPGSYNSQIGVPLSVWQIGKQHELGIFEAGISTVGEMEKLRKVIQPSIGIFTNLGSAHDEGFASRKEKAEEKATLFAACEVVIYCKDHATVDKVLHQKELPLLSWGFREGADIRIRHLADNHFEIAYQEQRFNFDLSFSDAGLRENAFHVIAFMLLRRYKPGVIQERIRSLHTIPMRLELKQGINRSILIDDSYNNDLAGLQISLDFLKNQQKERKTIIVSDIMQSGLQAEDLMLRMKSMVEANGANRFIGIGPALKSQSRAFPAGEFYPSTEEFLANLNPESFADQVVLIKGARPFQFEKIVSRLQRKAHGTVMEIDLTSLVHNLNYFKSRLKQGTKVMCMVKALAYGSGSEEVANLLQYHRVDYLGVAYADEGVELRKNKISLSIMVMNPTEESFSSLIGYNLEPEMYSLRIFKALVAFLKSQACAIHLKLDTGMHRLGFDNDDLSELESMLKANRNITVASIFTHLAGADEKIHDQFSHRQVDIFLQMADRINLALGYEPLRHVLNSPGILRLPQYQFDMVRLGIGMYGIDPTEEGNAGLKPVITLKTIISQIRKIKSGDTIGYGRRGKALMDLEIATIAIGYADGFSRRFSGGSGNVLINNKLAPVVGNVCMDMTMVDITGIGAGEGDEVIIFGPGLPIQQVAQWIETIPYEILTSTGERVKRVFFAEGI